LGTIIDYVKEYGAYRFDERKLSTEDILIFAQLSYLNFDEMIPTIAERRSGVSLRQINDRMDPRKVFSNKIYEEQNRRLWQAMVESTRFSGMQCNYYRSRLDEEKRLQFAAMTFFPDGQTPVITFRGTDETLVGWQEDFYMAFAKPIAAQKESAVYLQQVSCLLEEPFVVCGHSKGGNLAIYASLLSEESVQNRIRTIYSFDGPGFRPEILSGSSYENIQDKVRRVLPSSSLVGMLLLNYEAYEVIKSSAFGVFQHNCYTWQLENGELIRLSDIESKQKQMNDVLNRFIFSLSESEMKLFVDTFFEVLAKTGAATVSEFAKDWRQNLKICLKEIRQLEPETGKRIRQILKILFEIAASA